MASNIRINNRVGSTLQVGDVTAQSAYYGSSLVYTEDFSFFDPDALSYINAVEEADNENLELGVKFAINNFVSGCKSDGIWDAIKASCILAGARTLGGALVPLAGDAPTNFNFVSGDYNRVTGLKSDGSTKYLDSNRANDADPQDNNHNALWVSESATLTGRWIGSWPGFGANLISGSEGEAAFRSRTSGDSINLGNVGNNTLLGMSRSSDANLITRRNGAGFTNSQTSEAPNSKSVTVFGTDGVFIDSRMSFYSIGESLDLADLDARVSTLMTEIEAALT